MSQVSQTSTIPYEIRRSLRARRIRISVYQTGRVLVTIPRFSLEGTARKFVDERQEWIRKSIARLTALPPAKPRDTRFGTGTRREFLQHKEGARSIAAGRVAHFAARYGLTYKNISIRNQKTRWGSCSRKGNLSFSYRLALLPPELQDYLIVHEICHLQEFNHSRAFWDLVGKEIPNYKELRKKLRGVDG